MSRQETIMLFREFLIDIDPTLELLYKGIYMELNGDLITSPRSKKAQSIKVIQETPDSPMKTETNQKKPVVFVPMTNTLEDVFSLKHEFFHYIEEEGKVFPKAFLD